MCGIVGGISSNKFNVEEFIESIAHRGPDSSGHFFEKNLFLGHTRLSIQDVSTNGNQPMFSEDGRFVIIFNGEIYNHFELREQLLSEFNFKSTSDTETVLYLFIKYGINFLNKLNGIFAFALYDRVTEEIFIARDQFGVKPLYLYSDSKQFLFSSELKALLNAEINKEIDEECLVNYLTYLWSPGTKTAFKYVKKILPGHYLYFKKSAFNDVVPVQYYKSGFNGVYSNKTESELIEELDQLLTAAVKRQMLSDVPIGFFLSGGLDSTLLVALAKKLYPEKKIDCFTINIDSWSTGVENFVNDIFYAREAAKHLNVELHEVNGDINIKESFDYMIWHLDEPQSDAAPLNVFKIAKLAREKGIKVLIGGTAGDDVFSGYRRHQALNYENLIAKLPLFLRRIIKKVISAIPGQRAFIRKLKKFVASIDLSTNDRMKQYFVWLPVDRVKNLFYKRQQLAQYDPSSYFDDITKEIQHEKNLLNKMLFWESRTFLVDHNLNYTDKMGMAAGVEIRVPFLDMELVKFAERLPPSLKMKGNETKYLLKKVAERYLPHEIIYRPKTGFGAPVRQWINNDLRELIATRLDKERLQKMEILDPDSVCKLIEDNRQGKIDAAYSIFGLLAIESWVSQFR